MNKLAKTNIKEEKNDKQKSTRSVSGVMCDICGRFFSRKDSLKKHKDSKSCEKQYGKWSKTEEIYLSEKYEWGTREEITKKLKRSWASIQRRTFLLKLRRMRRSKEIITIGSNTFNYLITKHGYMMIYNQDIGINGMFAHRYIWESSNQKRIPEKHVIHHKDGNRLNNSLSNLALTKNRLHWFSNSISQIAKKCFEISDKHGFWERDINGNPTRDLAAALLLVITELSEAFEASREGNLEQGKDSVAEELADAMIRILDLSYGLGLHIENEILNKMEINKKRPFLHGKIC